MLGKLLQERYLIVRGLNAGGFCNTYLAQDIHMPGYPICVVKHLQAISSHPYSLPTLLHLFTREVEALQKLGNYDRVPRLLGYFEEHQEFFLVQEFIAGHALTAELQPGYRWREKHVIQLLQEVLAILEVVHSHGLIHRDLKPSNLIRRQQDGLLVLIDFNSVKQAWTQVITAQEKTYDGFFVGIPGTLAIGTPGYMPTEQGRGRPRSNSDIYALGMIGIQALTGLHPAQLLEDLDTGELIWQHQANVSSQLAFVLNKMVAYHFQDRYQTATEVLQSLHSLTNLYSRMRHLAFALQPSTQTQPFLESSERQRHPRQLSKTVLTTLLGDKNKASGTKASSNTLLVGLGIGIVSTIIFILSSYFVWRSLDPEPKLPSYPVSTQTKDGDLENISVVK